MSTTTAISQATFDRLAFPVIRVRYAGPTDSRGSRWIATMRRDNERSYRATVPYDHANSEGAPNALPAALECWRKARADLGLSAEENYIAIPGDLDANSYAFLMVPGYIFDGHA